MNSVLRALILALFTLPAWAEVKVEMLNPPENAWSKQVDNVYRLKLKETVKAYQTLVEPAFGELRQDMDLLLATNAEEIKQKIPEGKSALIVNFDGKQSSVTIKSKPYISTIATLSEKQMGELAGGNLKQTHEWLRIGAAAWISSEVMETRGAGSATEVLQSQITWLRESEDAPDAADFLSKKNEQAKKKGFTQTAILMTYHLKSQMGSKFWSAFAAYLREAAKPEFKANQAFEHRFGMTPEVFLQGYQTWIAQIKTAQYQHNQPVPPASGFATLEQADRYPLDGESSRKLYEKYLKARKPKALAISTRGSSALSSDRENAMALALKNCQQYDPVSCRLYAVDDVVVYQAPQAGQAKIEVRMASFGDDGWTRDVREKFMPIAERSTEALRKLLLDKTGTGLDETVRVHLASGTDDYTRALQDELGLSDQNANDSSERTGGMANGRGQIAVAFRNDVSTATLMERASKVPAHEIVHEWQNQQSRRYKGFKVPVWITEGTADLLAYEAIEAAKIPDTEDLTKKSWLKKCTDWYNRDGTLQAEEILMPNGKEWHQLTSKRRGNYQLAGLMVHRLREISGNQFHKALAQYFSLASQPGQKEETAFEQSFGLSRAAFLDNYKAWVKTL